MKNKVLLIGLIMVIGTLLFTDGYYLLKPDRPDYSNDPAKFERIFSAEEQARIDTNQLTLEEVSRYDGKDGQPAYIILDGVVYDMTDHWKKGRHNGLRAGDDLTEAFLEARHGRETYSELEVVGGLKE